MKTLVKMMAAVVLPALAAGAADCERSPTAAFM